MTLLGPGDAKHYRVTKNRSRWYHDPLGPDDRWEATDQLFPSVSKVKSAKGFDAAEYVAMKECAKDLAAHPQRYAGMDWEDVYSAFKGVRARKTAAKRGTAVHSFAEALIKGEEPYTALSPEEYTAYIPGIRAFLDAYQPELVAAETVFINRELGYAGTGDIILRIDGKVYMADWKSREEEPSAYPDDAAQIGAYSQCEYMIALDAKGEPYREPMPAFDGGIIISLVPNSYAVFPVDLDEAYSDFERLYAWYGMKQLFGKKSLGNPWAPRAVADPLEPIRQRLRLATDADDLYDVWADHSDVWTPELTELASKIKRRLARH